MFVLKSYSIVRTAKPVWAAIYAFIVLALFLQTVFCTTSEAGCNPKEGHRVITVTVFADNEFREIDDWQSLVVDHLDSVSVYYDSLFDMELEVTKFVDWESPNHLLTLETLHRELKDSYSLEGSDISIGFSLQQVKPSDNRQSDLSVGKADVFGPLAIVRFSLREAADWRYVDFVLIHELSHLFGAFHSSDTLSIMRSFSDGALPDRRLDPQTQTIITQFRDLDFYGGVLTIDTCDQRAVIEAFGQSHAKGEQNPIASALWLKAMLLIEQDQRDSAVLLLNVALPHFDRSDHDNLVDLLIAYSVLGDTVQGQRLLEELPYVELVRISSLSNYADACRLLGRFDDSHKALDKALREDPEYVFALFGKALTYIEQNDPTQALLFLDSTIAIDPKHSKAQAARDSIILIQSEL